MRNLTLTCIVLAAALALLAVTRAAADTTPLCLGQPATIVGTDGNDTLNGTSGDDVIAGLGGNDDITGEGGNDLVCGGSGNDVVLGRAGRDVRLGQRGRDFADGGAAIDACSAERKRRCP